MGLPWVRLDTGFSQNPKVLTLIEDKKWQAVVVYVASLGYSGQHGTDGFIPGAALPFLHGTKTHANQLVSVGLWTPSSGGYDVHGWSEFQPSDEETKARKARAKAAAELRWARIREASKDHA
jgi:hypothetical protein